MGVQKEEKRKEDAEQEEIVRVDVHLHKTKKLRDASTKRHLYESDDMVVPDERAKPMMSALRWVTATTIPWSPSAENPEDSDDDEEDDEQWRRVTTRPHPPPSASQRIVTATRRARVCKKS